MDHDRKHWKAAKVKKLIDKKLKLKKNFAGADNCDAYPWYWILDYYGGTR